MNQDSFQDIFKDKSKVMVVMAHPDDAEIYAGGLIARLIDQQIEVKVITVSNGGRGSRQESYTKSELITIRQSENQTALASLGIKDNNHIILGLEDGYVENNHSFIKQIVWHIRQFKPNLIITHHPTTAFIDLPDGQIMVNHHDHRHTAQAVIDASYPFSRDRLFFPEMLTEPGIATHQVNEFLLTDHFSDPAALLFDISDFYPQKQAAILAHQSQVSTAKTAEYLQIFGRQIEDKHYEVFKHLIVR